MRQTEGATVVHPEREEIEQFLDTVEEETAADGSRRTSRELLFGLLALPVLFAGLVDAIVWILPVVTTWLPVALEFVSLTQIG